MVVQAVRVAGGGGQRQPPTVTQRQQKPARLVLRTSCSVGVTQRQLDTVTQRQQSPFKCAPQDDSLGAVAPGRGPSRLRPRAGARLVLRTSCCSSGPAQHYITSHFVTSPASRSRSSLPAVDRCAPSRGYKTDVMQSSAYSVQPPAADPQRFAQGAIVRHQHYRHAITVALNGRCAVAGHPR